MCVAISCQSGRNELTTTTSCHASDMPSTAAPQFSPKYSFIQVHELAALQGPEASALYAVRHAERRFKQGEYAEAATVFAQHGISNNAAYFELYRAIALAVLSAPQVERRPEAERSLRDMLLR